MKYNEYIRVYIAHYKLDGLLDYARTSGENLFYKKVLIYILRSKFRLSFPQIGRIFKNNHATIMYHYGDILDNPRLWDTVEDAWKLYRDKK